MSNNAVHEYIKDVIQSNNVVLFMKGTANSPACGFSGVVARILQKFKVEFVDINVMTSNDLREGIKSFSNWPTIPQLYIKGEFVGGCDIVREMNDSGEFIALLKDKNIVA